MSDLTNGTPQAARPSSAPSLTRLDPSNCKWLQFRSRNRARVASDPTRPRSSTKCVAQHTRPVAVPTRGNGLVLLEHLPLDHLPRDGNALLHDDALLNRGLPLDDDALLDHGLPHADRGLLRERLHLDSSGLRGSSLIL